MYFADSDFLSIILMFLTIGVGIYSSLAKGKKKGDDSGNIVHEGEPSTFEELFGGDYVHYREEEDGIKEYEYGQENEYDCEKNEEYEECFTEEEEHEHEYAEYAENSHVTYVDNVDNVSRIPESTISDSKMYTFSDEHACSTGCSSVNAEDVPEVVENGENDKSAGLKEKLRQSPKDMVLFSEIMKPKYKDF